MPEVVRWGMIFAMSDHPPVRRYALARPGAGRPREEGVRRLRLVRMEAIAEAEREAEGGPEPGGAAPGSADRPMPDPGDRTT